jgi:hypothetical protein
MDFLHCFLRTLMNELLSIGSGCANSPVRGSAVTTVLIGVLLVAALYFGREVLVPIALAILMSFVLAPFVGLLQHLYIPRIAAVFLVVLFAFTALFALGGLMVSQVNQLARDLPRYQSTLQEKIQALQGAATGTGTLERASEVLQSLGKELDRPKLDSRTAAPGDLAAPTKPIPVEVHSLTLEHSKRSPR